MDVLEIDGSFGEGGGQILRTAISLSCITEKPIRIKNIRQNRRVPGLQRQHLITMNLLAKVSDARVDGMRLGSTSVTFVPQKMRDMSLSETVGTAGSIPLILQALIPAVALSGRKLNLVITGGTDVPWSPTSNYTKYVLGDAYARMGVVFTMEIRRRGYYPKGGGEIHVTVEPCKRLNPIQLLERTQKSAKILYNCTHITDEISLAAENTKNMIEKSGFSVLLDKVQENALNPGGSMLVFSSDTGSVVGADELLDFKNQAGFGLESAKIFAESNLGVDANLSDMLVMPLSLCKEVSVFTVNKITKHLETNLYITSKITGCKYGVGKIGNGYEVRIQGT